MPKSRSKDRILRKKKDMLARDLSMAGTLDLGLGRADVHSCRSSEGGNGVIDAIEGARDTGLVDLDVRDAQRVPYYS